MQKQRIVVWILRYAPWFLKKGKKMIKYPRNSWKSHLQVISMDFIIRYVKTYQSHQAVTGKARLKLRGYLISSNHSSGPLLCSVSLLPLDIEAKYVHFYSHAVCPCCCAHAIHFYSILNPTYLFMKLSLAIAPRSHWFFL